MASASAIADGFLANIGAASVLGPTNVSKNTYQVLESAASAACVVRWQNFTSRPVQFGDFDAEDTWTFQLRLYLRDTGDAVALLNRTWTVPQKIIDSLRSDNTIQGTCIKINSIDANQPDDMVEAGGHTWLIIPIGCTLVADW